MRSLRRGLGGALLLLAVACGSGPSVPDLPADPGGLLDLADPSVVPDAPLLDLADLPDPADPGDPSPDADPGEPGDLADAVGADSGPAPTVSWEPVGVPPGLTVPALWVNTPDDAWLTALGDQGVLHWDGQSWTAMDGPLGRKAGAATVWSPGPGVVWADGFRWDGQAWVDGFAPLAPMGGLKALWGSGASDLWAVPGGAEVAHWDGKAWTRQTPVAGAWWASVHGNGPADVWLAGAAGKGAEAAARVVHWDGKGWTDRSAGLPWAVRRVRATPGGTWACSATGRTARWDGAWHEVPSSLGGCDALWASGEDDLWMVDAGDTDRVARGGPGGWSRLVTGLPNSLAAVSGTATETWLAALGGSVFRLDRSACGAPGATEECCALGFARCRMDDCDFPAVVTATCPGGCPGCPTLCLPRFQKACCGCPAGCTEAQCAAGEGTCRYAAACWKDACGGEGEVLDACTARETCRAATCTCVSTCQGRCGIPDPGCGGTCECAPGQTCCEGTCSDDGCCGRCAAGEQCFQGTCCTPTCAGRICGGDSCGGLCGLCPTGEACCNDHCSTDPSCGQCAPDEVFVLWTGNCCRPRCEARQCGDDGCGGACGTCPEGQTCCPDGTCAADDCCGGCGPGATCVERPGAFGGRACCTPLCDGRECGYDGCGGSCGACPAGESCSAEGRCVADLCADCPPFALCDGLRCCTPWCEAPGCGDDGCGGNCGTCAAGLVCNGGRCCAPSCEGRTCGDDGCGGQCGTCGTGQGCCGGQCSDDPCCGTCAAKQVCAGGWCCTPRCEQKECGPDGCGGSCGSCEAPATCRATGAYAKCCVPDCAGKACGDDGCGGQCGQCGSGEGCCDGQCAADPCCGCTGGLVCQAGQGVSRCVAPACGLAVCGPGIGTTCGVCPAGQACNNGTCSGEGCGDQECGTAPDGSWCGACPEGEECDVGTGRCIPWTPCATCAPGDVCLEGKWCCTPYCEGRQCGLDDCGGSCGTCPAGSACIYGTCVSDLCAGQCTGGRACDHGVCRCLAEDHTTCGPDGGAWWVDSCGAAGDKVRDCPLGCQDGRCLGCTPDCTGRPCGDDGCGGTCGTCGPGQACFDPPGTVPECRPRRGLECCGDGLCWHWVDPAGSGLEWTSRYGTCPAGCHDGWCIGCTPSCEGRDCGEDGCGWTCGFCGYGQHCEDGRCVAKPWGRD